MAEFNIPNKNNYTIAAGLYLYIAKYDSNDVRGDFLPIGNVAEDPTIGVELETVENMTAQWGLSVRDRRLVISRKVNLSFAFNELVRENFEYLLGSSGRVINQSVNVRRYEKVTFESGVGEVNEGNAIVDVEEILPISGEDTYDEGASGDYTVTAASGSIELTDTSDIGDDDQVIVRYRVAKTASKFPIMDQPNINAAVQLINYKSSANNAGYNMMWDFPDMDINLDGDITIQQKDFINAKLSCAALASPDDPTGALGYCYQWRD